MENASKALLIAGAILICILLIAVAMYIYNSANATIKSAGSKMSQQEKDIYNANIQSYVNNGVKGSEIKSMIDSIISQNQSNVGEEGKFIGVYTNGNISNYDRATNLSSACNNASVYSNNDGSTIDDGENNETNVQEATTEMKKLKAKINSQKNYDVEAKMSQGIYTWIIISES